MKKLISTQMFLTLMLLPTVNCLAYDRYGRPSDLPGHHSSGCGWFLLIVYLIIVFIGVKLDKDSKK